MKKSRETHHIHMGILLTPSAQFFLHICLGLGLTHVESELMRGVLPVIGDEIVHMYRVPDQESQKTHRILVIRN